MNFLSAIKTYSKKNLWSPNKKLSAITLKKPAIIPVISAADDFSSAITPMSIMWGGSNRRHIVSAFSIIADFGSVIARNLICSEESGYQMVFQGIKNGDFNFWIRIQGDGGSETELQCDCLSQMDVLSARLSHWGDCFVLAVGIFPSAVAHLCAHHAHLVTRGRKVVYCWRKVVYCHVYMWCFKLWF